MAKGADSRIVDLMERMRKANNEVSAGRRDARSRIARAHQGPAPCVTGFAWPRLPQNRRDVETVVTARPKSRRQARVVVA
jgi:hypothetical protein